MKIGELARRGGCSVETVRFYEREGLLGEPERQPNGYRSYTSGHLVQINFIRHCRSLGMGLDEVRTLLNLQANPDLACDGVSRMIDGQIQRVHRQIQSLRLLERQLQALRDACHDQTSVGECGIMRNLEQAAGGEGCPCHPPERQGRGNHSCQFGLLDSGNPGKDAGRVLALERVISGGQTGADRAALDAALAAGMAVGGRCPRGRRAEDGAIPDRYPLVETRSRNYEVRTRLNVRAADGTLVLNLGELSGGTLLTVEYARKRNHPCLLIQLDAPHHSPPGEVAEWLAACGIRTLNIAGPRESKAPGIHTLACAYLGELFALLKSAVRAGDHTGRT